MLASIGLMLLWASWAAMISYGLDAIGYEEWQDPTTGMFMVYIFFHSVFTSQRSCEFSNSVLGKINQTKKLPQLTLIVCI